MSKKKRVSQLKTLLKKDLRLLFRKRVAIFVFGGPFIMMFLLIGLPSLFSSQQTSSLLICSDDLGYTGANIGDSILGNLTYYFLSDSTIEVEVVANLSAVTYTTEFGLYIPSNFSELAFLGVPTYYIVDATQSLFSESVFAAVRSIANSVIATTLANRTIPPVNQDEVAPASIPEELLLGPKAAALAMPLSYMIFLLIALNSGSYSSIGFAREKRMRTMEILLAYTHRHRDLVISKAITGLVASLGSTLSYVLGIIAATQISGASFSSIFEIFGLNLGVLNAGDIIVTILFAVLALLISLLLTMAIDSNLAREASERISPLVSIGLAMFFYFGAVSNPLSSSTASMINPFYWCYRVSLLLISGKFSIEIVVYISLIIALLGLLIFFSTRGIQKEKTLYLE